MDCLLHAFSWFPLHISFSLVVAWRYEVSVPIFFFRISLCIFTAMLSRSANQSINYNCCRRTYFISSTHHIICCSHSITFSSFCHCSRYTLPSRTYLHRVLVYLYDIVAKGFAFQAPNIYCCLEPRHNLPPGSEWTAILRNTG